MTGPHPSVALTRRAVRRALADVEPGATVVVACSGGPDSLALLAATVHEKRVPGWRVVGAVVDHGLQEGSAAHTAAVVRRMADLGADETLSARVTVDAGGLGPEAAAREARYAVLEQVAAHTGAATVLLGHTRDDQAETVLLGLARGSGGRSVAGMRPAFEVYRRPFLDVTLDVSRDDTVTACQVLGIETWHDPHNDDPGYARVRVRRTVLPVLEEQLGPGIAAALARTAAQLRPDMQLLDELADQAWRDLAAAADGATSGLAVESLAALHDALRRRVLHRAAVAAGAPASELTHEHVLAVDALLTDWRGQRWIDLPGPVRAQRAQGRLLLERPRG
ncbi:tRNA lysidine(34) synthetase TilS [Nocardioides acrostichi]|uniref:tRNA(Ile)-lysidine synthase n=1 Tax=Nocardioides acrostichi TaxID=2784339 RepID=A0A930V2D7_9ACTN|nr:tRNA lysidine(34) synthetase TilS [Nocardioides acrostichi]MBF4162631.1 tRNA lysidine(34) synthetase TilS [Nocardioides acrostichi]